MRRLVLGLDIGGTKIAGGLLTEEGERVARCEEPTEQHRGYAHSSGQMHRVIRALLEQARSEGHTVAGMGACAPGPMDPERGILFNPPNMQGWENLHLRDLLADRYRLPVFVDNDANAAGLAEARWGAAAGCRNVFYATISTGIGTGIVLDGKILHGRNGMAAEGGHVTIDSRDEAPRCNCGNLGCIEAYASGTNVARRTRDDIRRMPVKPKGPLEEETGGEWDALTMRHIARAAERGDAFCRQIVVQTGTYLGIWLGSVVSLLDPEIIVLGGGVSRIGEPLFEAIRDELPKRTINPRAAETPVVPAHLREDLGIYGAAALASQGRRGAAGAAAEEVKA